MSPANVVAALLALAAALASAAGDVVRQRCAQEVTDDQVGSLKLFWLSLRDGRWWAGGAAAVVNYALQAAALAIGSVMLVTGLQVTALLFALPMYARSTQRRVSRREWLWAAVLTGALAVAVVVGEPTAGHDRGTGHAWAAVALVLGPVLIACVLAARLLTGSPAAAVLLAVVAGSALAVFAVLTKAIVAVAHDGIGAVVRAPELLPWLLATLTGMVFQQSAFRAGALTASMPTMTVAKPMVATVLGVLVLGETIAAGGFATVVVAAAAVLIVVATAALARGEAAAMAADTDDSDTAVSPVSGPNH